MRLTRGPDSQGEAARQSATAAGFAQRRRLADRQASKRWRGEGERKEGRLWRGRGTRPSWREKGLVLARRESQVRGSGGLRELERR